VGRFNHKRLKHWFSGWWAAEMCVGCCLSTSLRADADLPPPGFSSHADWVGWEWIQEHHVPGLPSRHSGVQCFGVNTGRTHGLRHRNHLERQRNLKMRLQISHHKGAQGGRKEESDKELILPGKTDLQNFKNHVKELTYRQQRTRNSCKDL
jgi:hypothetical protein